MWLYGGKDGDTRYTHSHRLGDHWVYNILTHTWREVKHNGVKPWPRYLVGQDKMGQGRLYVFRDEGKDKRNDLWMLDVPSNKPIWKLLSTNKCKQTLAETRVGKSDRSW